MAKRNLIRFRQEELFGPIQLWVLEPPADPGAASEKSGEAIPADGPPLDAPGTAPA